jgi:flagellar protein FliO/FliZ
VLGLLWYLQRRVARRGSRRREADAITVLGRQGLGSKAQLVIVQTEDARYVLGVTEHRVEVIDRLPARPLGDRGDAPAVADAVAKADFATILSTTSTSQGHEVPQLRVRHRTDPLRGSILSPDTWRQTAEAIRRTR